MRGFPPLQIFLLGLAFGLLAIPLYNLTSDAVSGKGSASHGHSHDDHDHDHDHDHHHGEGEVKEVKGGADHPEGEHKHVEVATLVRLRFAHRPTSISLKQDGKELLAKPDLASSPVETKADIEVSHDGNELILSATWPEGTPDTAVTVELEPDGFETRSQTRWSSGTALEEVITFTW